MTLPTTQQVWHAFRQLTLASAALSVVAAAYWFPEARLPVVVWLLTVAVVWRRSAGANG